MDFKTILVDLSDDSARSARIETAARIAEKFGGNVTGLTATGTYLEPFRGAGEEAGKYAALAASHLHQLVARHKEALDTLTGQVSLRAVLDAVRERFPGEVGEGNARVAEAAHEHVRRTLRRPADVASG